MKLRAYQLKVLEDIDKAIQEGHKRILVQMPTGTGKTLVFSSFIKNNMQRGRILILVHRKELLLQTKNNLSKLGIKASMIQAGASQVDLNIRVQVAMVQTLSNRLWIQMAPKVIIVDEAHHFHASTYQNVTRRYVGSETIIMGYTATPVRLDGQTFGEHFDILVKSWEIKEFINKGFLSLFSHYSKEKPDLRYLKTDPKTKDYNNSALAELMTNDRIMADIIKGYMDYGKNGKTIAFCVNQRHAQEVCKRFKQQQIPADVIVSETPAAERERILNEFRNGNVRILCNVDIFTEGFDCPDIDCVILARPTQSLTLYMQQIGRVLRIHPESPQRKAIILDNSGNWERFGLVNQDRNWSLTNAPKMAPETKDQHILGPDEQNEVMEIPIDKGAMHLVSTPSIQDVIDVVLKFDNAEHNIKIGLKLIERKQHRAKIKPTEFLETEIVTQFQNIHSIQTRHFKLFLINKTNYLNALGYNGMETKLHVYILDSAKNLWDYRTKYNGPNKITEVKSIRELFVNILMHAVYRDSPRNKLPTILEHPSTFQVGNLHFEISPEASINLRGAKSSKTSDFEAWRKNFVQAKKYEQINNELMAMQVVFDGIFHN
jgi:superfamily II DNA or RNA helicase